MLANTNSDKKTILVLISVFFSVLLVGMLAWLLVKALLNAPAPQKFTYIPACLNGLSLQAGRFDSVEEDGTIAIWTDQGALRTRLAGISYPLEASTQNRLGSLLSSARSLAFVPQEGKTFVFGDGELVNAILLREGLAARDPAVQPCAALLEEAETVARQARVGIWINTAAGEETSPVQVPCSCSFDYECADFPTQAAAQDCYNACADYRFISLDEDLDGFACEDLP